MPLPNLLLIGAMKAGTTSLYVDIASHPAAFLPENKEPMSLCYDDVLTPAGPPATKRFTQKPNAD